MELLKEINDLWLARVKLAVDYRKRTYDPVVNRLSRYYHTRRRYLFIDTGQEPDDSPFALPTRFHRVSVALVGQFVRVMLPYVHFKVPVRTVSPRQDLARLRSAFYGPEYMNMPETLRDQQQCLLGQHLLNYAADDATFNLRSEVRKATQEALVTGRGVTWLETVDTPYGPFPGSFYISQRNVIIDPDHDEVRDANFIARFRERPCWEVAEEFRIPIEKVKPNASTFESLAQENIDPRPEKNSEEKKDLCQYWEVYSRMGLGHRITEDDEVRAKLEAASGLMGDHVYLACMPGMDYPLNLYPDRQATQSESEIVNDLSWPIKTFGDHDDPWPATFLDFYRDGIYPKPPLEDALPLQSFLDFAYFFLMQRIKTTSRSILLVPEEISSDLTDALKRGFDNEIVKLKERYPDIAKLVHELQFAPVNKDLWTIIAAVKQEWEDSTGLSPLLRGGESDKMMRSSAEAQIRQSNSQVRPDDLRDCATAFHGAIARKELIAQRTILKAPSVGYYFGETTDQPVNGLITQAWKETMQIDIAGDDDAWRAAQELNVTVEGSTGRRKNKEKQLADVLDSGQTMLPIFMQERQLGNPVPLNAYVKMWTDATEVENPELFQLVAPVPMGPPPGQEGEEQPPAEEAPPEGAVPEEAMMPQEEAMGPNVNAMGM